MRTQVVKDARANFTTGAGIPVEGARFVAGKQAEAGGAPKIEEDILRIRLRDHCKQGCECQELFHTRVFLVIVGLVFLLPDFMESRVCAGSVQEREAIGARLARPRSNAMPVTEGWDEAFAAPFLRGALGSG